jgi:putative endonuclease
MNLGQRGEDLAAKELERRGYTIVARRWRCRLGEIDLVAQDGDILVVVEVKARSRTDYGPAIDAVDARKRRKLVQLAEVYLKSRRLRNVSVRFDVVGVTALPSARPTFQVIRGAFEA